MKVLNELARSLAMFGFIGIGLYGAYTIYFSEEPEVVPVQYPDVSVWDESTSSSAQDPHFWFEVTGFRYEAVSDAKGLQPSGIVRQCSMLTVSGKYQGAAAFFNIISEQTGIESCAGYNQRCWLNTKDRIYYGQMQASHEDVEAMLLALQVDPNGKSEFVATCDPQRSADDPTVISSYRNSVRFLGPRY